jgi:hypothetical protein
MEANNIVYLRFFNNRIPNPKIGFRHVKNTKYCHSLLNSGIYRLRLWSTYRLQNSIIKSLKENNNVIRDDHYILCPIYGTDEYFSDFQFGATETRKENETSIQCLKRCLGEELGFSLEDDNLYYITDCIGTKIYCFDITSSFIKPLLKEKENEDETPDDTSLTKVASIIYGYEKDIINFLDTDYIFRDTNSDKIVGIAAVTYLEAKKFFK